MTTVPHQSEIQHSEAGKVVGARRQDTIRSFARAYMGQGWHCLLLSSDSSGGKVPPSNCPRCSHRSETYERHDAATCACLLCHGFYAATVDPDRFDQMLMALPGGHLAIRTGAISQLVVVDAEATGRPGEPSGLEVLDDFASWTGGLDLPATLTARSVSGGLHLFYRCTQLGVTSGRILPGVDVKAEAGYVGAASGLAEGRSWLDPQVKVADIPAGVLAWLTKRRNGFGGSTGGSVVGRGSGQPEGYDFGLFVSNGCPGGMRDYFINDLAFRLRKRGLPLEDYMAQLHEAWEKLAQPPEADYLMPWADVRYKAERVWATQDASSLSEIRRKWTRERLGTWRPDESSDELAITRIGTKNVVRRPETRRTWR